MLGRGGWGGGASWRWGLVSLGGVEALDWSEVKNREGEGGEGRGEGDVMLYPIPVFPGSKPRECHGRTPLISGRPLH